MSAGSTRKLAAAQGKIVRDRLRWVGKPGGTRRRVRRLAGVGKIGIFSLVRPACPVKPIVDNG
jgi:hypothetical protein